MPLTIQKPTPTKGGVPKTQSEPGGRPNGGGHLPGRVKMIAFLDHPNKLVTFPNWGAEVKGTQTRLNQPGCLRKIKLLFARPHVLDAARVKTDFKTALFSVLIVFGIVIAISTDKKNSLWNVRLHLTFIPPPNRITVEMQRINRVL